ncbi:MAG: PAS domain-containing protein [Nitrospirae bacterium]|nr:PAS domain-containing protein [Nitrospirota bacterium]
MRKSILLSFFLVLTIGGIALNVIFQHIIRKTLFNEGLAPDVVESICGYFAVIGFVTTIAGVFIILCIAFFLSETITRPLKKLTAGMLEIAQGKWDTRIRIDSRDEVGQLANGFNFMAEHIEDALKNLKASKEYNDNIMVSVPSILIVLSNKLNIFFTNRVFEKLHDQFPSFTLDRFITPLEDEIKKNLKTGETLKKDFVVAPGPSDIRLIFSAVITRISGTTPESDNEEKAAVLLTITDITERTRMKEMVLQSKQDWEDTFNAIPDMITIHDKDFNIIQANRTAQETLRLPELYPGKVNKCYRYYHGTDSPPQDCPSCQCVVTTTSSTYEIFEPNLEKFIEIRSIPRLDGNNEMIGIIHIARDITQRKQMEEEHNQLLKVVTRGKIEWEATVDTVTDFIILIDKELKIKRCNSSFARYAGVPANRMVNRKFYEFLSTSDTAQRGHCEDLIRNEEPMERTEVKTADDHWFYVSQRPIRDKKGNYLHTVVIATDITGLKSAQQKLKQSEQDLKRQVEDLEKFYEMAVGRELKMKELKREIRRLNSELSQLKENELVKT